MRKLLAISALVIALATMPLSAIAQAKHTITITWTYTQGSDTAVSFNVYRAAATGGPFTAKLNAAPIPYPTFTFTDTTGTPGTTYFYVATAVDTDGVESGDSATASATLPASIPNVPSTVRAVVN